MNRLLFSTILILLSFNILAQPIAERKHSFTFQGATFINSTISEEKVKNIYKGSFVYSYRIFPFIEAGIGIGPSKGQYITLKDYFFKIDNDDSFPVSIDGHFLGYNTIRKRHYNYFGRLKINFNDDLFAPFILVDIGWSNLKHSGFDKNFNLLGLYFTPSVGYNVNIFESGKIILSIGLDNQKIRYEKIESYYIDINKGKENEEEKLVLLPDIKKIGIKEKYISSIQLSVGFCFEF